MKKYLLAFGLLALSGLSYSAAYEPTYNTNYQDDLSDNVANVDPYTGKVQYVIPLIKKTISSDLTLTVNISNIYDGRLNDWRYLGITPLGMLGHIASGMTNIKRGNNSFAQFVDPTGYGHIFYLNADGAYYSTDGWKGDLTKSGDYYKGTLRSPDGHIYTIAAGANGYSPLTKESDITGNNFINYTYSGGFYLSSITTSDGYSVNIRYTLSRFNIGPYDGFNTISSITTSDGKHYSFSFPPLPGWRDTVDHQTLYITLPDSTKWGLHAHWVYNDPNHPKFAIAGVINLIDYPNGASQSFNSVYTDENSMGVITTNETNYKLFPYGTINYKYTFGKGTQTTTETLGNKQIQYIFQNPADYQWNKGLLNQENIIDLGLKQTVKAITNTWSSRKLSDQVGGAQPLLTNKVITQDGATYTTENKNFDDYGYPLQTVETGNDARIINRTYHQDVTNWIFKLKSEQVTNTNGIVENTKSNKYNGWGQLTSSITNGVATTYTYDANSNVSSTADAFGHLTWYKNYISGHPTEVTGPVISSTGKLAFDDKYTVNPSGTIASYTDSWGNQTVYTYDLLDRLTSIKKYQGLSSGGIQAELPTTVQWNVPSLGDQTVNQGTISTVTSYSVNKAGNIQKQIVNKDSATGKVKTHASLYDNIGNVIKSIIPIASGNIVVDKTYDILGRILSTAKYNENASQQKKTDTYGGILPSMSFQIPVKYPGTLTDLKFKFHFSKSNIYNGVYGFVGLPVTVNGVAYTATNLKDCEQARGPEGYQYWCFSFELDLHNQAIAAGNALSIAIGGHTYIANSTYEGNYTVLLPVQKSITAEQYSANTVKQISPLGKVSILSYQNFSDPSNTNVIQTTDGLGRVTTTNRDVMGRILSVTQNSLTHFYTYDPNYHFYLMSEQAPELGEITYARDILGHVTAKTIGGKTSSYSYDEAGNLINTSHQDNAKYHDSSTQRYDYGKLVTSQNDHGVWTYSYNALGSMATATYKTSTASYHFVYGYDSYGTLSAITYPDGQVYNYAPNALGEATQAGTQITGVTYFNDGVLSGYNTQSGNHVSMSEDDLGRLNSLTIQHADANLYQQTYFYDLDNNLSSIVDAINPANNQSFGYDNANQLVSGTGIWGNAGFSYDDNGNLNTLTIGSRSLAYQYNTARNLLTSVTGTQPQTFSYDDLGNMSGVGGNTLTFNDASQLVEVKTPTKTINYSYDANFNRVSINDGTNSTLQLYINNNLMYEVSEENQANKTDYIYLDGKLVNKVKNGVSEYLFSNLWGSPVAASSDISGGALLWTQEYAPYGKEVHDLSTNREKSHIGYTGKVFDNDIGLNYMNARYYDPEIGRFISYDPAGVDPSSPLTFNRYAYAANNPYFYIDPTGMSFFGDLWGGVSHYFGEIGVAFSYGFGSGSSGSSMKVNPQVNGHNLSYGIGYWSGRASLSAAAIPPAAELDAAIGGVGYLIGGRYASQESTSTSKALAKYYPDNNGFFMGEIDNITLPKGTLIDRFGSENGRFLSPVGTPMEMRALPPSANTDMYNAYKVIKPLEVQSGRISPAFNNIGLGRQYLTNQPVKNLIGNYLEKI